MGKVVSDSFNVGGSGLHEVDDGYIWNWVSLRVQVPGKSFSSALRPLSDVWNKGTIQVNCNSPCAEIIDSQNTADNITAHLVEYQHLPDWIAIFVQDRGGMRDKTASRGLVEGCVIGRL